MDTNSKPITVLTPVYNAEPFLEDTIDSILCQTFTDFELLLIDDASTDRSREIILSYNDPRIKYLPCKHDFIGNLNKGFSLINSKYIAQIDHDDLMTPYRLQIQYDYMESNPHIGACGGYMYAFGKYHYKAVIPLEHDELIQYSLFNIPVFNSTGFIRKDVLTTFNIQHVRGYSFANDYKFWTEIAKVAKIANIPKVLTLYRTSDHQTSFRYRKSSMRAVRKTQMEMVEYFFSHVEKNEMSPCPIHENFVSIIRQLKRSGFFSDKIFFSLISELITGLRKSGVISV